jgi:hypothetical protein
MVRRVRSTAEGDETSPDGDRLAPGVRIAMLAGGVALIVLAGALWWPAPPATVQSRSATTVSTTSAPGLGRVARRSHATMRTTTTTTTTSQILDGRADQASEAQPAGSPARRSETITVALIAAALLLWLLAAMGRVPSRLSFGALKAEYRPLTREETKDLATKVTVKAAERGMWSPEAVGSAFSRAYSEALREKRKTAFQGPGNVAWGADLVDTYFDKLADEAVSEEAAKRSAGDAESPGDLGSV